MSNKSSPFVYKSRAQKLNKKITLFLHKALDELKEDLNKEIEWCENWDPPLEGDDEQLKRDDVLMAGHFSLMSALVDNPLVEKETVASGLFKFFL